MFQPRRLRRRRFRRRMFDLTERRRRVTSITVLRSSALIGTAGEHYVLYRLARLGLQAALAPRNEALFDVMVFGRNAMIQVKTRTQGADKGWMMRDKHEGLVDDALFYAFVDI